MLRNVYTAFILILFSQPAFADEESFKLMRNSWIDASMIIFIATFDSDEGLEYNSENCWLAADLFQNQLGVMTRFWCETTDSGE